MQALGHRDIAVAAPAPAIRGFGARPLRAVKVRSLEMVGVLAVALAATGLRLLTRSTYLFNWDSVQFALGVQRFDIAAHRPHPPGYLGYIVLGRLFTHLSGGSAEGGLVLLSALASGAVVVVAYCAGRDMWGRGAGWAAAMVFLASPLAWIYGSVALTYALDPLFAVLVLWMSYRACRGDGRALILGAAVAGLAGAIRPTDEAFLIAPLAWAAWRTWRTGGPTWRAGGRSWRAGAHRTLLMAGGTLAATTVAWLGPLLVASGGVDRYLVVSKQLSDRASDTSAVWKTGLYGLNLNGGAVLIGLAMALGVFVPIALSYAIVRRLPTLGVRLPGIDRDYAILSLALLTPALGVYVLVHIGQLGYILLLLPALALPAGVAVDGLVHAAFPAARRQVARAGILGACVLVNAAIFALPAGGMRDQVVQHDRYTGSLISAVREFDPSSTVLVTSAEAQGSYRLAQYYLGSYPVVAVGMDRRSHAGEMFSTRGPAPEYDLARFDRAGAVSFPAGTRTVLVLDQGALDLVGDRSRVSTVKFGDGWRLWVMHPAATDTPVAAGSWVYLRARDCPCRGASTARPVPAPGTPL